MVILATFRSKKWPYWLYWPLMNLFKMLISFVQPYKIDSMHLYLPTIKFSKQYCKAVKMSSVLVSRAALIQQGSFDSMRLFINVILLINIRTVDLYKKTCTHIKIWQNKTKIYHKSSGQLYFLSRHAGISARFSIIVSTNFSMVVGIFNRFRKTGSTKFSMQVYSMIQMAGDTRLKTRTNPCCNLRSPLLISMQHAPLVCNSNPNQTKPNPI